MAASRRHYKFLVRDEYGNAISNAKLFLYQPGTTNDFTGTAYNAFTGGSTVTNPFITNSQGEIEAWFDNAQVLDIPITDNSDTATRAGSSSPISFSSFTEKDEIATYPGDLPTTIGTAADLTDITAGAQTEVVGTSTRWAPMDHVHGHTALSADPHGSSAHSQTLSVNPHGAGDHTNTTRQVYLPAAIGTPQVGALASLGTYPNILRVTTLADAVNTNGIFWHFTAPDDWASGNITIQPIWVPGSTDGVAHTVRWQFDAKDLAAAADVTAAGTTVTWTGASATRTANQIVYDTATDTTVAPSGAGIAFRFAITRLGSDGADTYVGVVNLAGVLVSYTANQ